MQLFFCNIKPKKLAFENGYRNFILISHNRDIDIIRNHPDFIELIDKYSTQMKKLVEGPYSYRIVGEVISYE